MSHIGAEDPANVHLQDRNDLCIIVLRIIIHVLIVSFSERVMLPEDQVML